MTRRGRLVRQTWADGFHADYAHLVTGEVSAIRENGGLVLASFGYDDLGRRTSLVRANGTTTTYGYDGASQLTGLVQDLGGGAWDQSVSLGYNAAGQIASRTGSNDGYAWTGHYDRGASEPVDGLNRAGASGGVAVSYDARGNVSAIGAAGYGYNSRNQLFAHDPGQLFYRNPAGLLNHVIANGGVTNLDYAGSRLASELDGNSGVVLRRYVYGPGTDEPLVWYEGSGTGDRRYLHADERGSIVAVSNDAGAAIAIDTYDEYGVPGANNIGRFQYTGQKWIPELGLYDYKNRMYSPKLGRFMQTDPIGYGDGLNLYGYVHGDPVNATDPFGLDDVVVTGPRLRNADAIIGGKGLFDFGIHFQGRMANDGDTGSTAPTDASQSDDVVVTGKRIRPVVISGNLPAFIPVQASPGIAQQLRDPTRDGLDHCGGSGATAAVPDSTAGGQYIGGACARHDDCYSASGTSRFQCDVNLYRDIRRECEFNGGSSAACTITAYSYYIGVRNFGWLFYQGR